MELQEIVTLIELLFRLIGIALVLSTISRFTSEGMINAWGITSAWMKRALVLCLNTLLVFYAMFVHYDYAYIEGCIVLLLTCAGADSIHSMLNKVKAYKEDTPFGSQPETTEYDSESVG